MLFLRIYDRISVGSIQRFSERAVIILNFKRILGAALCAAMLLSSTSCMRIFLRNRSSQSDDTSSYEYDVSSYDYFSSEEESSSIEFAGTEYGNETVGWFTLDSTFFQWYTPGNSDTCVQYAKSPTEILTMDVFDCAKMKALTGVDFDSYTAANTKMYQLEQESKTQNIEKLTGSREPLGNYAAYQVYCYYPDDDQYLVTWFMDSPDMTKVYYVAAEFKSSEMDFFDYAQTYRMPGN